jgi:RHS repeat-associated protein
VNTLIRLATQRMLAAIVVVAGTLFLGIAQADCGSVPGGPPNSCLGVASTGGNGGPDAGVGNPINVMTGNKYEREVDMPALPGVLGLEIIRHYNSANSRPGHQNGSMGRGWRLSYETELYDAYGKIQVMQGDGGRVIFDHDLKNINLCSTPNPANGKMVLVPQKNGSNEYIWIWTNGRKLYFDKSGKLYRIKAPTGETVSLDYDPRNVLQRVTDPQGRSLDFTYFDPKMQNHFRGVQFIDSPVGRFEYQYGSELPKGASATFDARQLLALMVRVKLPTGFDPDEPAHPLTSRGTTTSQISRLYHHEDPKSPWVMTGISVETTGADKKPIATRYSTYGYDGDARAILSSHANNVDKVTLDTSEGGKTVLTNSLGQKTTYLHTVIAGEHRLLEVRGAGCALCGETNVRYGYNPAGQLTQTTRLAPNGEPVAATRVEFDKLGRTSRLGKVAFVQGKGQPVQWMTRFEYQGDSFAPSVIARPSVVPGKEVFTRIVYNNVGQPLSVTESGWVPTFDGAQAAAQIERTTRYRYAKINDWSLLTEIDGPLPNGKTNSPLDSDVTVIEYDNRSNAWVPPTPQKDANGLTQYDPSIQRAGIVTRIIAPGNFVTEVLKRDRAQRPTKLRTTDGDLVQVATLTSNWRGAPLDIDLAAGALQRHIHYDYNAAGQVASMTLPGKLRTAFQYDQAGQLHKTILPDGSGILTMRDTEGRTERSARYLDAESDVAPNLPDIRFAYDRPADQPGRLTQMGDALGVFKKFRYNDVGQVDAISNALGIASKFAYGPEGLLSGRTDAADSADAASISMVYDNAGHATNITAANGVITVRRYDDFGQKVMEADPDHGVTLFRYDSAGRMVARIDETMVATRFTFDHANRLLAVGADKQPNLTQYQYKGQQLTMVTSTPDGKLEHATERTEYQRDAFGQVIKETRWLADVTAPPAGRAAAAPGLNFVTASEYDAAGRLVSQTLPDGHRLQYRYAPAGDDAGSPPRHKPGQLEAILFDDSIVVTDIEQTIAGGMTGYTMSNGMRQQISLDRRGRIEQLQVLSGHQDGWWQRLKAWFGATKSGDTALYKQVNRYDEGGRLIRIDRQTPSAQPGTALITRRDRYAYDGMGRLTTLAGNDGTETTFRYDKGGNRIGEAPGSSPTGLMPATSQRAAPAARTYHYAPGSNRLLAVTQGAPASDASGLKDSAIVPTSAAPTIAADAEQILSGAWFYHPTGVQLAQLRWMNSGGASNRRIVYNSAKRPIAVYDNDQLIARYHYNSRGERIAKTVYPVRPALRTVTQTQADTQGDTTYSLYRDQRLAAETDSVGHITAHYIYLYGKPVAKIEMAANDSGAHKLWKAVTMRSAADASDTLPSIYAIVTDHLGTPQQVMDERQQAVWLGDTTAFGQARVLYAAATGPKANPFVMNLRLPGQVFDAETKLNYNYLRDYDPEVGRYTTPDPAGLGGGFNPYAYVSNNPLTNIDPMGLYEEDIHYYMTYFLALAAGVDPRRAYIIATGAQYVDDNLITQPMAPTLTGSFWQIVAHNSEQANRLASYHFTERVADDWSQNAADRYIMNKKPENTQLQLLQTAASNGRRLGGDCAGDVMLGEYLHAFEDTFGHRDENNIPIQVNSGWGHARAGHAPDHTYNEDLSYMWEGKLVGDNWKYNEARTLEMEKEVFDKLSKLADGKNPTQTWDNIKSTLTLFNAVHEDSAGTNRFSAYPSKKIDILNVRLSEFGYRFVGIDGKAGELDLYAVGSGGYDERTGKRNRDGLLQYTKDGDGHKAGDKFKKNDPNFKGVILP